MNQAFFQRRITGNSCGMTSLMEPNWIGRNGIFGLIFGVNDSKPIQTKVSYWMGRAMWRYIFLKRTDSFIPLSFKQGPIHLTCPIGTNKLPMLRMFQEWKMKFGPLVSSQSLSLCIDMDIMRSAASCRSNRVGGRLFGFSLHRSALPMTRHIAA